MPAKKSPQLVADKVIGARFTPSEQATIEIARGARKAGTWLHDVALAEINRVRRELETTD